MTDALRAPAPPTHSPSPDSALGAEDAKLAQFGYTQKLDRSVWWRTGRRRCSSRPI